jgi:hypothetical protein
MSKRSVDPVTPIDVSKRHKTELSELVEDDLHSSFLSLDISDLSPLSPLPKDYDDIVDPLTLSNGMYHWTFIRSLIPHVSRFWVLASTCGQEFLVGWREKGGFEGRWVYSDRCVEIHYSAIYLPPSFVENKPEPPPLSPGVKKVINKICDDILSEWPPFKEEITAESKNVMVFTTAHAFYELLFVERLQLKFNGDVSESPKNLQTLLEVSKIPYALYLKF